MAMAKAKKRVAAHAKSSKRGKASGKPAHKKAAKRAMPKKAKSKVRRAGMSAPTSSTKKKQPPKIAARKAPRQAAKAPVETTVLDVIQEPIPGVVVVTEHESVGTAMVPISPGSAIERSEGASPEQP
jgi:hypothetical protein